MIKVSFDEFMKSAREHVDNFEQDYLYNNKKTPDKYPLEIDNDNVGVWWETLFNYEEEV